MSDNVFCGGCGKPISLDTSFCGECGMKNLAATAIDNAVTSDVDISDSTSADSWSGSEPNPISSPSQSAVSIKKLPFKFDTKLIGIIAVSFVLILIAITTFHFTLGNGNSKVVANKFLAAYLTYDGDDMLALTHEKLLKAYLSDINTKQSVFEDRISSSSRTVIDSVAAKINVSTRKISDYTSIEIVDSFTPSDRDYDAILDEYERLLDIKISDIKTFTYELTFDNESTIYTDYNISLIKINSTWYWNFLNHIYLL